VVRKLISVTVPEKPLMVTGIADADLVFEQEKQAAQPILNEGLRAQAQRQAGNAEAGEQRLDL